MQTRDYYMQWLVWFHSVTVAASDINDNLYEYSNYGKCVSIIAPVSCHISNTITVLSC